MDGPAWEWADGTAIYALEGVRVPDWVPNCEDPSKLLALDNVEQRRVGLDNYGWPRAVEELGLQLLDADTDPHVGSLYALPEALRDEEAETLLIVKNNSPHPDGRYATYGLMAGRASTALEAQADIWGLGLDDTRAMMVNGVRT